MVDFKQKLNEMHGIEAAYQRLKDKIEHPEKRPSSGVRIRHAIEACEKFMADGVLNFLAHLPTEPGDSVKDCVWECSECNHFEVLGSRDT